MLRASVFRFQYPNWTKCGGCNNSVEMLYVLAQDIGEARRLLKRKEAGLCGDCLCDLLVETELKRLVVPGGKAVMA